MKLYIKIKKTYHNILMVFRKKDLQRAYKKVFKKTKLEKNNNIQLKFQNDYDKKITTH